MKLSDKVISAFLWHLPFDALLQAIPRKRRYCRYRSAYIPNQFSDHHRDTWVMALSHFLTANMAFHPYRQWDVPGCMEVHKHRRRLPYRLHNQHLLLMGYTSNHSCEVKVYFFSPAKCKSSGVNPFSTMLQTAKLESRPPKKRTAHLFPMHSPPDLIIK